MQPLEAPPPSELNGSRKVIYVLFSKHGLPSERDQSEPRHEVFEGSKSACAGEHGSQIPLIIARHGGI